MTVEHLLTGQPGPLSSRELSEWMAWDNIEHGLPDAWRQSASICTTLANIHRDPKRQPFKLEDFMPTTRRRARTAKEAHAMFKMFAVAHNASESDPRRKHTNTT